MSIKEFTNYLLKQEGYIEKNKAIKLGALGFGMSPINAKMAWLVYDAIKQETA